MVGSGAGVLLFSAAAGYWVLERAEAHKGSMRKAGRVVGWLIIVSSFVGIICRVCYVTGLCTLDGAGGRGGFCPFSMKAPAKPAPPQ